MNKTSLRVAGCAAAFLSAGPVLAADQLYVPLLTYRTGAFAGSGIPIADGMHDYLEMLNQRDGGIGGRQDRDRGVRDRLRRPEGRRVLREHQGQGCADLQPLLDRHHAAADPQGLGRQDPGPGHGLRSVGGRCRRDLPLDLQSAGHLLGRRLGDPRAYRRAGRRARQAAGQEDRLHLSRRRLWPRADPAPGGHGGQVRLRAGQVSGPCQRDAEPELAVAQRPPRPPRLHGDVGLGCDEPDCGQGGGEDPLPDGQVHRHLVVGRRG